MWIFRKYQAIPSSSQAGRDPSPWDDSDAADEVRRGHAINSPADDRGRIARLTDRCHEGFNKHRKVYAAMLFAPTALFVTVGGLAAADDPDDVATYGLAFGGGALLAALTALGLCVSRRGPSRSI